MRRLSDLRQSIVESQFWKSIFRVGIPNTNRKRVLAMLGNVVLHLHPVKTRKSGVKMRYTWCAGGVTFFLFLVLTFTGLLLMFYYRPTVEYAFVDILDLREQVPFGIMREVHRWGAHAMVITVWIHMFRVFMTGSYKPPREFNWVIGVILLVLTLLLSFTGYLLPWDQLAIWAITVGSNMAAATPLLGIEGPGTGLLKIGDIQLVTSSNDARFALLGGRFVGAGALLRFYVLHCVGIPLIAAFLMAVHFWRVRKDGGISDRSEDRHDQVAMAVIQFFKDVVNFLSAPQYLVTLSFILLVAAIHWRRLWTKKGGIVLGVASVVFLALSYLDPNFNRVATLPDNVPIVGMIFLVGFFFWWAMNQAYENDRRIAEGRPTIEGEDAAQKVFSWPDLVYVELICLVVVTAVMIVWSIALKAPLEEPANPADSPNPSKAPWYFLGLQEILVYYDPWMAGVVLPSLIIVGLMAIPYIDTNPKGNGYFTFRERRWEITIFLIGFLVLWCILIVLGTFLRGPNWNFFGPYEFWDINKLVPLNNINLSEIVWIKLLKTRMPDFWLWREIVGLALVALYMGILPPLLAKTVLRRFYEKMGTVRFLIGVNLALIMLALPIKMYLRWIFNLKYLVNINEFGFNI